MRDALIALAIGVVIAYGGYHIGYNRAQGFYVARIEQTERAIRHALQGSSQTLSDLSTTIEVADERDRLIIQEIIDAAPLAGDHCRIDLDRLRPLDAIAP